MQVTRKLIKRQTTGTIEIEFVLQNTFNNSIKSFSEIEGYKHKTAYFPLSVAFVGFYTIISNVTNGECLLQNSNWCLLVFVDKVK